MYFVAVYMIDKAYGGPEEGGWWYDAGILVKDFDLLNEAKLPPPKVFKRSKAAYDYAAKMDKILGATLNVGRRPLSSVLSEGVYAAMVMEDGLPDFFPERKPHYE